jgi:PPOX class probable F420-dependent enzyme
MSSMTPVTAAIRAFLADGPFGHLVTLNPDGTPHVSLVWAGFDGDDLTFATFTDQHKLDNIRRDPRVTVSFQANQWEGTGLHPYMVVRGRATITEGGSLEVMDRLAEAYIGPGEQFPSRNVPPGFVTRVSVENIYGLGPWRKQERG